MIPEGKGIFIWKLGNAAKGDLVGLKSRLVELGFQWVAIKCADGPYDRNGDMLGTARGVFGAAGLGVVGWQYLYGANTITGRSIAGAEADAMLRAQRWYGFDALMLDPEVEYKRAGAKAWAKEYMGKLRDGQSTISIGLCSFRFPSVHRELPWLEFLAGCDFHAPQVYWQSAHNPAAQLGRSVGELVALRRLPVVPVGSAYREHGWEPSIAELHEFNRAAIDMRLPGLGWWVWDGHVGERPEFQAAIGSHRWGAGEPPPPPTEPPAGGYWRCGFGTGVSAMNLRDAPSGQAVGHLTVLDLPAVVLEERRQGEDVWWRVGVRQWAAHVYRGRRYLEKVT